jgi:predicted AAA+ superfamily ATPase
MSSKRLQIILGPRQVGKTTLALQLLEKFSSLPQHFCTGDEIQAPSAEWITQQWLNARNIFKQTEKKTLLVVDEVQKIPDWSGVVKKLWDEDQRQGNDLVVLLLGSSQMLLQKGMTESLAGRFEMSYVSHWSYLEMKEAFDIGIDEYIFYGGYPGAIDYISDWPRWQSYVVHSLIETTVTKDILLTHRIDKPLLFRRMFEFACQYSCQILSYQKMIGQLQDAGNTTTLATYLTILGQSALVGGLEKYAGQKVKQRASSPKLQVHNLALKSALQPYELKTLKAIPKEWGRWVESVVGAHLLEQKYSQQIDVMYWKMGNYEVDFVVTRGREILALEVKSGLVKDVLSGLVKFKQHYPKAKTLLIGEGGIPVETFLLNSVDYFFEL